MSAVFLALALAATTPLTGPVDCKLSRLPGCPDTNYLVWDKAFGAAVRHFLGSRRANYLGRPGPVADQVMAVLGGPPDDPTRIGLRYRFTACRAHSCGEKGAAVLDPDGRLVAVAILHSACGRPHATPDCFAHETLNIFVRTSNAQDVVDDLSNWARSEVARGYRAPGEPMDRLDAVKVDVVAATR